MTVKCFWHCEVLLTLLCAWPIKKPQQSTAPPTRAMRIENCQPRGDQKTMQTRCLSGFPLCVYQNFCLFPWKLGFLVQQRPNLAQIYIFGPFWPNISISDLFCAKPDHKTMQKGCLSGFLICGYKNFCSLQKWLGCLAQKRPFLSQNTLSWAHIGLAGSSDALLVVGGWLCCAGLSRKTPIWFILFVSQVILEFL